MFKLNPISNLKNNTLQMRDRRNLRSLPGYSLWFFSLLAALLLSNHAFAQQPTNCSDLPDAHSRSLESAEIRRGRDNTPVLDIRTELHVRNTAQVDLDLSYDLVVLVGGVEVATYHQDAMFRFGEDHVLANDAIRCAILCASKCGSIFGNGTCIGGGKHCGCNYGFTTSVPLPHLNVGEEISVLVRPADGSDRDTARANHRIDAQFLSIDRPLARR